MATKWWGCPECCEPSAGPPPDPSGSGSDDMEFRDCAGCPGGRAPLTLCVTVQELLDGFDFTGLDPPCEECEDLVGTYILTKIDQPEWADYCVGTFRTICAWGLRFEGGACGIVVANLRLIGIGSGGAAVVFTLRPESCGAEMVWGDPNYGRALPGLCLFDDFEVTHFWNYLPPGFGSHTCIPTANWRVEYGLPVLITACGAGDPPPFPPPARCDPTCCGASDFPAGLVLDKAGEGSWNVTADFGSFKICGGAIEHAEPCKWTGKRIVSGTVETWVAVVLECVAGDSVLTAYLYGHCVFAGGSLYPSQTSVFTATVAGGDCQFDCVVMDLVSSTIYPPGATLTLHLPGVVC